MDLEAIKQRAEKATPGPWDITENTVHVGDEYGSDFRYIVPIDDMRPDQPRVEDAAFIAHARDDVRALVARVEELELVLQRLVDACDENYSTQDAPVVAANDEATRVLVDGR
jgi:hypothetical protein